MKPSETNSSKPKTHTYSRRRFLGRSAQWSLAASIAPVTSADLRETGVSEEPASAKRRLVEIAEAYGRELGSPRLAPLAPLASDDGE